MTSRSNESRSVRDCWPNEASDFTPWLAEPENLAQLSALLGVELIFEARERRIGRYRADLLCTFVRDGEKRHAVIENQLERSDHRHYGQLMTYAGELDDLGLLVWIAPEFTEEHLRATKHLDEAVSQWDIKAVEVACVGLEGAILVAEFRLASIRPETAVASPARRRDVAPPARQRDYDYPERIAFLTAFVEWTKTHPLPVQSGTRVRISGPSETPPFVELNLGKASILLKSRVSDSTTLGVELLVRRFRGKREANYDAYIDRLSEQMASGRAASPRLSQLAISSDRERRFFVTRHFEAPITDATGIGEKFHWIRDTMEDFLVVFEPTIRLLDEELGR